MQQRLRRGDFKLFKVDGEKDPGDIFTKASLTLIGLITSPVHWACSICDTWDPPRSYRT